MGESTDSSYVNAEAQQTDNIDGPPNGQGPAGAQGDPNSQGGRAQGATNMLPGYASNRRRGYFLLPPDAAEDHSGVTIWHHDS